MKPARIDLRHATVAVTGAGRGIGRATAEAFARRGARVALGDIDLEAAEAAATKIGRGAWAFPVDVTQRDHFAGFLDEVERGLGPLDVLVNNAGIMPAGPFLAESDDTAAAQIGVNLTGPLLGMKLVLPEMIERGRGHVVNVASMAGKTALPGLATYCATKSAVVGLSAVVRRELQGSGVTLTTVCPGVVDTELSHGFPVPLARFTRISPEQVAGAILNSVERRPAEVAVPSWIGAAAALNDLADRLPLDLVMPLLRRLGLDAAYAHADSPERLAYQERLARDNHAVPA